MLCRFWVGPVVEFYLYWMPKYFRDVRGLSIKDSAYFNSVTFVFGDLGSIGGGVVAGLLIAKGFRVKSARQTTLFIGAALCLLSFVVPTLQNVPLAIAANFAGVARSYLFVREYVRFDFRCVSQFRRRSRDRINWRSEWRERYAVSHHHWHDCRPLQLSARVFYGSVDADDRHSNFIRDAEELSKS